MLFPRQLLNAFRCRRNTIKHQGRTGYDTKHISGRNGRSNDTNSTGNLQTGNDNTDKIYGIADILTILFIDPD